jgi:hypothetical protein
MNREILWVWIIAGTAFTRNASHPQDKGLKWILASPSVTVTPSETFLFLLPHHIYRSFTGQVKFEDPAAIFRFFLSIFLFYAPDRPKPEKNYA